MVYRGKAERFFKAKAQTLFKITCSNQTAAPMKPVKDLYKSKDW